MTQILLLLLSITMLSSQEKEYFQQEVNYQIDVSLNDEDHTLSAYEKIEYKNNSPDELTFIWFHIWPNAYKDDSTAYAKQAGPRSSFAKSDSLDRGFIDSLDFKVNGKQVKWTLHPEWIDVVKIELNEVLKPGQTINIETPFFVKIPKVFSRLGHTGKHYEITQWYPKPAVYDKKGWHPMPYLNQGEFYSEFGTFDVKITLPKDYKVMATGDLVNGEEEYAWLKGLTAFTDSLNSLSKDELKKWIKKSQKTKSVENRPNARSSTSEFKTLHFRQTNVHDFAWFADKKWLVQKGELSLPSRPEPITLWSFYLPKNAELWRNSIEYLHDSGYWFSKYYGDYPYNHITAVDGDLSAGGGMEYPNITVIATMPSKHLLELVIMHEVGHNWFYGIIGSNERYHTWMDEGLNDYSNIRYWEDKYKGENERFVVLELVQDRLGIAKNMKYSWFSYLQYALSAKNKNVQPLNLKADEYTGANYGLNYSKTGVFTRFLHHYLGNEKMDEIMKAYYEKWKYKHPYPEDFEMVFKDKTDKDLTWYFDGVFNTTNYIDFSIRKKGRTYLVSNHGTMSSPVEIVFYGKDQQEIERVWLENVENNAEIKSPEKALYAVIDPDEFMPDVKRENNSTKSSIRLHWVWDQPTYYDHDLNLTPWAKYNYYNGLTPGIMIYKGGPGFTGLTALEPMWDLNNEKLVGKIYKVFNYDENNLFGKSSLSIGAMRLHGTKSGNVKYSGSTNTKEVSTNFSFQLNHNSLNETAFDTSYYESGSFVTQQLRFGYNKKFNTIINNLGLKVGVTLGNQFSSGWIEGKTKISINEKNNLSIRSWVGNHFNTQSVPKHYRTYLSGGIDPTFSSYVFDRTGKSSLPILKSQYLLEGPALRGLYQDDVGTTSQAWGLNLNAKIAFLPNVFYDLAGGVDYEIKSTAGIQFGPIIIPLYQSWEAEGSKTATDSKWILERLRFQFGLTLSGGPLGIRIGS